MNEQEIRSACDTRLERIQANPTDYSDLIALFKRRISITHNRRNIEDAHFLHTVFHMAFQDAIQSYRDTPCDQPILAIHQLFSDYLLDKQKYYPHTKNWFQDAIRTIDNDLATSIDTVRQTCLERFSALSELSEKSYYHELHLILKLRLTIPWSHRTKQDLYDCKDAYCSLFEKARANCIASPTFVNHKHTLKQLFTTYQQDMQALRPEHRAQLENPIHQMEIQMQRVDQSCRHFLDPSASTYGSSSTSTSEAAACSKPSPSYAADAPSRSGKRKRSQDNEHQLTDHPHADILITLLNASAKWTANQSPTRSLHDDNLCLELADGTKTPVQRFYQTLAPHLQQAFTDEGFTPLMAICACNIDLSKDTISTQGYKGLFQRIIKDPHAHVQASLSQGDYKGATALGWACYYHHDQLIPDLLKAGASIDKNMCPVFLSCLLHPKRATIHAYQTLLTIILSLPQEQTKLVANLATQTLQEQPLAGEAWMRTKTLLDILANNAPPICMMPQGSSKTTQASAMYFQVLADLYEHHQEDAYPAWKALIQPYMEALITTYQPSILLDAVARDTCFRPAWTRFLLESLCKYYHPIDKLSTLTHALSALESKLDDAYHLPTLGYYLLLRQYLQRCNHKNITTDLSAVTQQAFFHIQPTDSIHDSSTPSHIVVQACLAILTEHCDKWSGNASPSETGIRQALAQTNAFIDDQGQRRLKDEIIRSCKLPAVYALLPEWIYKSYPRLLAPYALAEQHQRTCLSIKLKATPFRPSDLQALFAGMHARVKAEQLTPQDIRKSAQYATAVSIIREVFDAMVKHSALRDRIDDTRSDDMHTTYIPSDMVIALGLPHYFTLVPLSIAYRASWILGEKNWQELFQGQTTAPIPIRSFSNLLTKSERLVDISIINEKVCQYKLHLCKVIPSTPHLFSCLNHDQDHTIYQLAEYHPSEINNLCTFCVIFTRSDVCHLIIQIHRSLFFTEADRSGSSLHQEHQTQKTRSFQKALLDLADNKCTDSVLTMLQGHSFKKPLLFLAQRASELQHLITSGEQQPPTLRTMIEQRFTYDDCLACSLIPNTFYGIKWESVCISPALQARYRAMATQSMEHQVQASSSASSANIGIRIHTDRLVLKQEIIDTCQHLGSAKQLSENERKAPLHRLCIELLCEARAQYQHDPAYRNKLHQAYSEHQATHTTIPEETIRDLQLPDHLAYIPLDMLWLPNDLRAIYTQKAEKWLAENGNSNTNQTHYVSDQLHGLRKNITQCFTRIYTEGHRITDQEKKHPIYQTCMHIMEDIQSKNSHEDDASYVDRLQQAYSNTHHNHTCLAPEALHEVQLDDYLYCVPIDILRNYLQLPLALTIRLD